MEAPSAAADHWDTPVLDGRVTNGAKGVAYLRDHYLPVVLAEQIAAWPSVRQPIAGS